MQDEHGEVCPVNWTQGQKTIKEDPVAKLEYFESVGKDKDVSAEGQENGSPHTNGSAKRKREA